MILIRTVWHLKGHYLRRLTFRRHDDCVCLGAQLYFHSCQTCHFVWLLHQVVGKLPQPDKEFLWAAAMLVGDRKGG